LRGTFEAAIAGEPLRFDTRLGTIAAIEERCGDQPIVEIVNAAVFGRRARDRIALLAAAIAATGRDDAEVLAADATVPEAEGFILALMEALGFTVASRGEESRQGPLAEPSTGDAGGNSPSAD
jgi:hypothetical protein